MAIDESQGESPHYMVTATTERGRSYRLRVCCERDAVSRVLLLDSVCFLQQPGDLPKTCPEHAYPTCQDQPKGQGPDSDDHEQR